MILSDIHSIIRESLGRGTAFDSSIPVYVEMAAQWLEQNYSMPYMERLGQFTLDPTRESPNVIAMPSGRTKSIKLVRQVNDDGSYTQLPRVDPDDVVSLDAGVPSAYWIQGHDYIIFDAIPEEELNYEILWVAYSEWPLGLGATHPLITQSASVLIAKTLLLFAALLRDTTLSQAYQDQLATGLKTLLLAVDEGQHQDRNLALRYNGELP